MIDWIFNSPNTLFDKIMEKIWNVCFSSVQVSAMKQKSVGPKWDLECLSDRASRAHFALDVSVSPYMLFCILSFLKANFEINTKVKGQNDSWKSWNDSKT